MNMITTEFYVPHHSVDNKMVGEYPERKKNG